MKKRLAKEFKNFEIHHKILTFVLIIAITILITRIIIQFYDPNPLVGKFQLHHFDYGLFLLLITVLFMLFDKKREMLYLVLCAVSIGLILDEIWFIRKKLVYENNSIQTAVYNSTFPYAILFFMIFILIVLLIKNFSKKK